MKRATGKRAERETDNKISIHALVKRATLSLFVGFNSVDISIHALVKRATDLTEFVPLYDEISIHALVKRAT